MTRLGTGGGRDDLIAGSIYDEYSVGPSIQPVCTTYCFTMTNMIQVCSNFHEARVFVLNSRRDEIGGTTRLGAGGGSTWGRAECRV